MSSYSIEVVQNADHNPCPHDYGLRRSAWIRAMTLLNHLGSESALDVADARADRAFERGDHVICRRWRDLIVAIHALEADEPRPGECIH